MKTSTKLFAMAMVIAFTSACSDSVEETVIPENKDALALIGQTEERKATPGELASLPQPGSPKTEAGCMLDGDSDCTESKEGVEYYIQNCTTYPKNWPPSGVVNVFFKGLAYYVDGDGDINLDQYQDDLQQDVNEIVASTGPIAFVKGDVISWECNGRQNNVGVIKYTVYK